MVRNPNVIKDTMKLGDNIVDLRGQITRVDSHDMQFTRGNKTIYLANQQTEVNRSGDKRRGQQRK